MANREPVLRTKRLEIRPMTDAEIRATIEATSVEKMKNTCARMLELCARNPENRIWYAPWKICLKKDQTRVGELGFQGPVCDNTVEIGFGINEDQRGNGYTSEALSAVIEWAFSTPDVFFIEAEAEDDNHGTKKILEKLEFKPDGIGEEGTRYVREKVEAWLSVYMCFGMAIGTALGASLGNIGIGISLGLCVGMAIGAMLDSYMKKKRAKARELKRSLES